MEVLPSDSPNKLPSPDAQDDNAMDGFSQKKKRTAEEILEGKEAAGVRKVRKEDGGVISVKLPTGAFEDEEIPKNIEDTLLKEKGWMKGRCNCRECRNYRMRAAYKASNLAAIPE